MFYDPIFHCDKIDSIGILKEGEKPPEGAIVVER